MTFLIMRLSCLQKQHVDDTAKFSGQRGLDTGPSLEPQLQKLQCTEAVKNLGQMFVLGTKKTLRLLLSQVVCLARRGLSFRVPFIPVQSTTIKISNVYLSKNHSLFPQQMSLWQPYASYHSLPLQATHSFPSALPVAFLYCKPASE